MTRVFVPLLGDEGDAEALAAAVRPPFGAHAQIEAVFLHRSAIDTLPILGDGYGAPMIQESLEAAERDATAREATARAAFDTWQAGFDPAKASFATLEGVPDAIAVGISRTADVTVLARPGDGRSGDRDLLVDALIAESGRPVLLAPTVAMETIGVRVLIAWNGSAEAARAMAMCRDMLGVADAVTVLQIGQPRHAKADADAVVAGLSASGVAASVAHVEEGPSGVADTILDQANSMSADLIIIGAYSHSRMRERIFGGVTRDLVENANWPVVMAG